MEQRQSTTFLSVLRKVILISFVAALLSIAIFIALSLRNHPVKEVFYKLLVESQDVFTTLRKVPHVANYPSNAQILSTYASLTATYLMHSKSSSHLLHTKFFNYSVDTFNYYNLQWLFFEIFVLRIYQFTTDKPKPFIIDCGGNMGMSVLFFKMLYPQATIEVFEPGKHAFEILTKNIEQNKLIDVHAHKKAIYKDDATMPFYYPKNEPGNVGMSLLKSDDKLEVEYVDTVKLSHYIDRPVDFLKLDIEGVEADVIQEVAQAGKLSMIEQMVIEFHHSNSVHNKLSMILKNLEDNGFEYLFFGGEVRSFKPHKQVGQNFMIFAYKKA